MKNMAQTAWMVCAISFVQGTKGFLSLYFYCHSMYIKR